MSSLDFVEAILAQEELGGSEILFEGGIPEFIPSESATLMRMAAKQNKPSPLEVATPLKSTPVAVSLEQFLPKSDASVAPKSSDSLDIKTLAEFSEYCSTLSQYSGQSFFDVPRMTNAKLLIVDWAPQAQDFQSQNPHGFYRPMLDRILKFLGLNFSECAFTYYYKKPLMGKNILPRERKLLTNLMIKEIELLNPNNILLLGENLGQALLESNLSHFTLAKTEQLGLQLAGKPMVTTYNLEQLTAEPGLIRPAATHLDLIKGFL